MLQISPENDEARGGVGSGLRNHRMGLHLLYDDCLVATLSAATI